MTTGNSRARLPLALGADRPVTVPRGNAEGRVSGPVTLRIPAEPLPLWPGGAGSRCDGDGDGDLLAEGDGLGQGALFGDDEGGPGVGDLLGHGDLLGEGDGLGEGALLGDAEGDGELVELVGDGDGDVLAAAPVLGRTASRIPAAIAPPPAMARAPARGRAGTSPL